MIKRWYFNHGQNYEDFAVLYDDGRFTLVQNVETKAYSFGLVNEFGTLYGFPIGQSCLTLSELVETLQSYIEVDESYNDINQTKTVYESMINAAAAA